MRNDAKKSVVCKDGIERKLVAGLCHEVRGYGWYVRTFDESGFTSQVYFGKTKYGGIGNAYDAALEHLKKNSENQDTFVLSNHNRLGRRIAEMESMSIKYEDRDHMPLGISYYVRDNGGIQITASLITHNECVYIPANRMCDWEAIIDGLRIKRLNVLCELSKQRHVDNL